MASVTGVSPESTERSIRQRLLAIASSPLESVSHFGTLRGRCFRGFAAALPARGAGKVFFMFALLREGDHRLVITDPHLEQRPTRADREVAVPEAPGEVEGLARRLLAREAQRVLRYRLLDRFSHRGGRAEEPIGGGWPPAPPVPGL